MKKLLLSLLCLAGMSAAAQSTYEVVTDASAIEAGAQYILVADAGGENGYWAMGASNNANPSTAAYRKAVQVTLTDGVCNIDGVEGVATFTLVAGTETGSYALQLENESYITFTGASTNNLNENAELTKAGSFMITIDADHDNTAFINNCDKDGRALKFNYNGGTNPRYANYSKNYNAGQPQPYLCKLVSGDKPVIARPKFSVASGMVAAGTQVEITCDDATAAIYYTLDGTNPTNASTKYTAALTINATTTVKAVAYVGANASSVVSATYTVVDAMSFEEVLALENEDAFIMDDDLVVAYVNEADGRYNYVYKGGAYGLVYGNFGLKTGDVIAKGWTGKMSYYNGLPELVPANGVETTGATATAPEFATVAAADITPAMVNTPVVVKDVVFAEATPDKTAANFVGTVGETELNFRNTYKLETVEAGTYTVTCIVSVYTQGAKELGTDLQLVPVSFGTNSGIAAIETENGAEAVYYNLQGVRVAQPESGLYIEVRGGKATKVVK